MFSGPDKGVRGGNIYHRSFALLDHGWNSSLGDKEHGPDVNIVKGVILFGVDLEEGTIPGDAAIVEQDVQSAEIIDGFCGQLHGLGNISLTQLLADYTYRPVSTCL